MGESRKAFPLWEQTKLKYVQDMWRAQALIIRYQDRKNPRDLHDLQGNVLSCWMNIRSYRDKFEKKAEDKENVKELEEFMFSPNEVSFRELVGMWKFLNDAYKKLGIDDVGKMEDEDDYKTAILEGLFD